MLWGLTFRVRHLKSVSGFSSGLACGSGVYQEASGLEVRLQTIVSSLDSLSGVQRQACRLGIWLKSSDWALVPTCV